MANLDAVGRFLQLAGRYPLLSRSQEIDLIIRSRDGDRRAIDSLVLHNLRLIAAIAKKYSRRSEVPLEDLLQEGVIGIHTAIAKFDINKGCKFSTYATWWIRQSIVKSIENGSILSQPAYFVQFKSWVCRAIAEYKIEHNKPPTIDYLVDKAIAEKNVKRRKSCALQIKRAIAYSIPVGSLDDNSTESGCTIVDLIASDHEEIQDYSQMITAIANLPRRYKDLLIERYLLDMDISAIAAKHHLARSTIQDYLSEGLKLARRKMQAMD